MTRAEGWPDGLTVASVAASGSGAIARRASSRHSKNSAIGSSNADMPAS
jgi:hypothetical protein